VRPTVALAEVHYAPAAAAAAAGGVLSTGEREFVELWNTGSQPIDISHWRLNTAVDYSFAPGTLLAAQARLVVVAFDPAAAPTKAAAFRQLYGIGAAVPLAGPWTGALDNGGETLELERPEDVAQLGLGYVLVDRVEYDNATPWPAVETLALSIHRDDAVAYGDFASSWTAGAPSPGSGGQQVVVGDFNGDTIVELADIDLLCGAIQQNSTDRRFDLSGNQTVDFADMEALIENVLGTSLGDANLDGIFNSSDLIDVLAAGQYEDGVPGNSRWATGDWNCDGEFNTSDILLAFQKGGYSTAATAAASAAAPSAPATPGSQLALAAAVDDYFGLFRKFRG
jgi:hypothetical protein